MTIYFKYFFMFPKISHYYVYFFLNFNYFFKFNYYYMFNIKKFLINYSRILLSWLKIFKNNFLFNSIKTLPVSYLATDVQVNHNYFKKNFQNIFLKNLINKSDLSVNANLNSIFSLLFLHDDFSIFIGKKLNVANFSKLILNLKFNYFLLLINANWHLILNINNIYSSIRHSLISVVRMRGARQYGLYSPLFLWKFWSNFFFVILNVSFYNVQILAFSRVYFKKIADPFNWLSWSLSFFFWKSVNKNFFFRYTSRNQTAGNFFRVFKSWFSGLALILDSNYHFPLLQFFSKYNIFNFALLDTNHEPWLSWYPIPSRGSDITLQYLFLILIFKIRLLGLNFFFFFKFYYIYTLRLINLLQYFNNSIQTFIML